MDNFKDYKTIQTSSMAALASSVQSYMLSGWVLQGGVSIAKGKLDKYGNLTDNGKEVLIYVQAMALPQK